jgi:plastocyanin
MRKLLVVVAVVLLALGAACADDSPSDGSTSASGAPSSSDQPLAGTSPSGDGMTADGDCQDATEPDGPADLEMQDFVFAPSCLEMSTEQGLRIHNEGENEHNFNVEGFGGLDVDVAPGDENNTEATGLNAGEYTFFCKYHRESNDMEGKLVVKAAK